MSVSNSLKAVAALSVLSVCGLFCITGPQSTVSAQGRGAAPEGRGAAPEGRGGAQGRGQAPQAAPYKEMPVTIRSQRDVVGTTMSDSKVAGTGTEVYFMNCWMCPSEYSCRHFTGAFASGRYQRLTERRSPRTPKLRRTMPAFKQLTDANQDLLALFTKRGTFDRGGCFDGTTAPSLSLRPDTGAKRRRSIEAIGVDHATISSIR